MREKRKFGSDLKAQIVLSIIKKEVTAIEAAKKHEIAPGLIYKWRDEFLEKAPQAFETGKDESDKDKKLKHYEHVIMKMTTQNDFLEKVLATLK
jgi:transposase-like protein